MWIKEIVIDGFKSYAQRTEVKGFDPLFNAITGLNGSGKSNILDSICFLLGITNLQQVRASNLQELVYKGGQSGITKATVTITFDNVDKKQSPVGYDGYDEITVTRQVVIGGRNKYLINGSNAQNARVQDLFRSVQLNINNPHFLIMQGRITKVLNMKPPEILAMIEEAAGTSMYEQKKASAQKTIEKKDFKLKEINNILAEEITPTLKKLKDERSSYLEFQKVQRELDHLSKLHIAYQFLCADETSKQSAEEMEHMAQAMNKLRDKLKEIDDKIVELTTAIRELEKKRDAEAGGAMDKLEAELTEVQKKDAKAQAALDHKKESLKTEKKKKKDLEKNYKEDQAALKSKEKEVEKINSSFTKLQDNSKEDAEAVTAAQKHFHAVSAGLSSNDDGEDKTLADQLMDAKNLICEAETQTKQAQMKLKVSQTDIKKKQAELKKTEKEYQKDQSAFQAVQKNKEKLEAEMKKLNFEEGKDKELANRRKQLTEEVSKLRNQVDTLEAKYPNLQFEYKDPEKNFDRSKVKGLVAQLINVKDINTAAALEAAAGGKLYNVVVDNEVTVKKLLQKGQLKRRYTFIPLNKITSKTISPDVVKRAESLVGKENVNTALSLIDYDKEVKAAMEYSFGTTLVCDGLQNAKKVCFDPKVMTRTVTLGGDQYDPSGVLSGGASTKSAPVLATLNKLKEAKDQLNQKEQELAAIIKELDSIKKDAEKYQQVKTQYDLKAHEVSLLEARLKQSTHHQQLEEINTLQQGIDEQETIMKEAKDTEKKMAEKVKNLEAKIKDAKSVREKELKAAEDQLKKAKKKAEESTKRMKEKQQEVDALKLEAEELTRELTNYEDQMKAVDEAIAGYEQQVQQLSEAAAENQQAVKAAQAELNKQREKLKECDKAINDKATELQTLKDEDNETQLQMKETEHKIAKHNKDSKDAARMVEHMLEKYEWIAVERQFFGQPNTAYDFKANDPKEAGRRLQKLQETRDKLAKNVNQRAMNMLSKAEEKYNDLMKKKQIVENDKKKILATIIELDEKKSQALRKAWEQVNKDFGSIFSTLLPGTNAKLAPPEGQSVLDGLEVKVAFGDVWKESLTELSGGQRSLVALSLILSLLLFKPAPLYILDEVDAALDLSHTQNIGQMLRTHFKHSQFIVVSLKDGMFNNANVLFKTKFVDGVSTVTRYVQSSSRGPAGSGSSTSSSSTGKGSKEKGKKTNKKARIDSAPLTVKSQ
ncbi:structural maintenance of chromosomes protein 2-like [Ptychodera flava]|uniref:structural maintenance of chromosomes protein 2-like n=1 Tax=Ptychodera flava TaxID=63121 RepID=UPI003969C05B